MAKGNDRIKTIKVGRETTPTQVLDEVLKILGET